MIVFTTPDLPVVQHERISSIVSYAGSTYCLMEVEEHDIHTELKDSHFWWELAPGYIDAEKWDYDEKFKGGLVEGIDCVLSLSKEKNIAMAIFEICRYGGEYPFILWENQIEKPKV